MDYLSDAKTSFRKALSYFREKELISFLKSSLKTCLSFNEESASALEWLLPSEAIGKMAVKAKAEFLALERCLLCHADYILSLNDVREFDRAFALEKVRQEALSPILEKNESLQEELGIEKESPILRVFSPKLI